ncbi:unnamed protein product [Closterium sp. Naga37s-1]|nr:unnamed protein product [Closterium sp. Naga37s-1]
MLARPFEAPWLSSCLHEPYPFRPHAASHLIAAHIASAPVAAACTTTTCTVKSLRFSSASRNSLACKSDEKAHTGWLRASFEHFPSPPLPSHRVCPLLILSLPVHVMFPPSVLSPVASGVVSNYLIGSVPALWSGLLTLDLQLNFLTDLPAAAYLWCGATSNCLVTPSKCATLSTAQRPAADCAFCGTTNAVPPFCSADGGVCSVDAFAPVAAGTASGPVTLALPWICAGGSVAFIKELAAMLALKSSLGVTHTTWASNSLCTIQGKSTTVTTWAGVFCDSTGSVVNINMYSNLFFYRLDFFTTHLRSLPALADIGDAYKSAVSLSVGEMMLAPYGSVLQGWQCAAGMAVCCRDGSVLQGWQCAAGMAVCCRDGSVLQGWQCAAGMAVCCRDGSVLQGWQCAAGMAVCCRDGSVVQGWQCAAGMAVCCRDGSVLQGWQCAAGMAVCGAAGNYLIGSVPALAPGVDRLDLRFNYLTDLPTAAYQWCGANLNCLFAPSKCTTSGTVQRPAANCAFCGSTNGFAPFCSADGGVCSVDAFAPVAAGTAGGPVTLALPWICAGC